MKARIGWFFVIVGGLSLLIFFASDVARETAYPYLCVGMGGVVIGLVLCSSNRSKSQPSGRFNMLRKNRESADKPKPAGNPPEKQGPPHKK
jgi:hypothetical protein